MGNHNTIQNNVTINNFYGVQENYLQGAQPNSLNGVNDLLSDIFSKLGQLFDSISNFGSNQNILPGGCVTPPRPSDSCHPQGSLKTDGNAVTTPGGYKIEATGQFEWTITGPDGKSTRVWGDPHVAEGDGGKWDFKRDSTFVLGDGTKINVTTAPWGKGGMTVTSGLEIISGNDRVNISDIDKGKGKIGQITQDGYARANSFGGKDVFVMGKETDDWSFQGKEVIGSNNGGDSFKLGNDLAAGNTNGNQNGFYSNFAQLLHNFVNSLTNNWQPNWKPNDIGQNPYNNGLNNRNDFTNDNRNQNHGYDRSRHQNQMRQMFSLLGDMFKLLARFSSFNDQMLAGRNRMMTA